MAPLCQRDPGVLAAVTARLRPFHAAGVLGPVDIHVVDHLGAFAGESDPDVLLGLALAVRAPRFGHICVDLGALKDDDVLPDRPADDTLRPPLPWPVDRVAWLEKIAASPLVRSGGAPAEARPFVLFRGLLYSDRYFVYQERLARALRARTLGLRPPADAALLRRGLDSLFPPGNDTLDRQKLGAAMTVLRGFTVISGGPGTGKTWTVRSALTLLWAQWAVAHPGAPGPRVALAAPTGKAAARMKEAIAAGLPAFLERAAGALPERSTLAELEAFLTALQPATLHRLLGWTPANPTRFRHDAAHPVPYDVVIVDEASMVDFALMTKLVDAVGSSARLVLLGDQHQLASVEAGTVLSDLCGPTKVERIAVSAGFAAQLGELAGVLLPLDVDRLAEPGPQDAIVQLSRSRRFSDRSGVGAFARACLAQPFDARAAVAVLEDPAWRDVHLETHGPRGAFTPLVETAIVAGYRPYLDALLEGPRPGEPPVDHHARVLTLLDRFRVLCAHRQGRLGVGAVNAAIIDLLRAARIPGLRMDGALWPGLPLLVVRNDPVVRRYNGDVGVVVRQPDGTLKVAFRAEGGVEYLAPARLPEHETVFAMTIHKSQGSEFDHALVVLPERPSPILTRELVYTAVTRAKREMTLVGDAATVKRALQATVRRASGLRAELWGPDR